MPPSESIDLAMLYPGAISQLHNLAGMITVMRQLTIDSIHY
jgi:hypothetical protein